MIQITVEEKRCKRCGFCIAFCPKGVFGSDNLGRPTLLHLEKCNACNLCVLRCPDFAVEVGEDG